MTTLRKVLPFTLLALVALWTSTRQAQAQNNPDCSFTFKFTGNIVQPGVSNLSGNTPCVNWRLTLSTDAAAGGTLSSTVTFQTSPDNFTWSVVPNTPCSSTVQPPCVLQGANPIVGTQGMLYSASYGAYVRVVVTASAGAGTGTIRAYGAKGASASAGSIGGGGSSNLSFVTVDPVGACTVGVPNEQNTVTGALLACVGPPGPNNGTWALIVAANSSPLLYYYTNTASSIATYLQATSTPFSPKTTLTFAGLAIGTTAFQNWATNAGVPGLATLPAGIYTQHIHALKSAGGNVTLHTEFWEVSSTGVDIAKIGTTEESAIVPGTEAEFTLEFTDGNVYTMGSVNSRVVGRVFATVTGFAATVQVFVGGTADSRIQIPGSTGSSGTGATSCPVVATASVSCPVNLDTTGPLFADCWDATSGQQILVGSTGTHSTATTVNAVYAINSTHVGVDFSGTTTATCYISTGGQGPTGAAGANGSNGTNGAGYGGTSVTSMTPGTTTGATTITASTGLAYVAGSCLQVTSSGAPTAFILGPVIAYNSGTGSLTFTATTAPTASTCSGSGGSGAHTDWVLSLAGTVGATGATGAGTGTVNTGSNPQMAQYVGAASTVVAGVTISNDASIANGGALTLAAQYKIRTCTVITGDPGSASPALADDNDSPVACGNTFGADWTIQSVTCWANAGSPTVTPILTGGSGTSILTGALTCGTAGWAAGTVQGTAPIVHTFSGTGATCSSTPCTIDMNITTAGGTAKYIVVRITGTL